MLKQLFYIFFFIYFQSIVAQHPISVQLTEKDGLPDIEFYDVIEDDKGFIWFACNKGLYRYDGKEFKNYSHSKKRGLSVFNLLIDEEKRLWCTNVTGQFFYVENDELHLFLDIPKKFKVREKLYKFSIFDNHLIVLGNKYLYCKNLESKKRLLIEGDFQKEVGFQASTIKNDTLYILKQASSNLSLSYIKKGSNLKLESFQKADLAKCMPRAGTIYNYNGEIFFQDIKGAKSLFRSVLVKDKFTRQKDLPLKELKRINTITVLDNKQWFLTERGAEVFFQKSSKSEINRVFSYFPRKSVTEVIKDQDNNYWFTTLRNGVYVVPNININAYDLQQNIGNISAIENVGGTHIYFGTTLSWLGIYDLAKRTTKYIKLNTSAKISHILYNEQLNDVYIVSDGPRGSFIIDALTQKVTFDANSNEGFSSLKGLCVLNSGDLFTSSAYKNRIYSTSKGEVTGKRQLKSRGTRNYHTLYDFEKEDIYRTYIDDFVVYDKNFNPKVIRYKNKPIFARSITQTVNGLVWVSTFKNGILVVKDHKVIKQYTTSTGLLSNETSYVKSDGNNVWITSKKGLQLLETKTNTFKNLTRKDGIESFNINGIEVVNNTIWFSSNLGLFSFDKTKVFRNRKLMPPYFTSVVIQDSSYTLKPKYIIKSDDKRVSINFNANGFKSAETTQYQYRLQGLNTSWKFLNKGANEVVFNNLKQGNYNFQLRTVNGKKNSKIKEIKLEVKGVFYQQWWFVTLVFLLVFAVFFIYFNKRLKDQEEKRCQELEKQQNELEKTMLKLENLRSQMNPHFVFNALNSIQDYIINNEKDLAGDYLGKFSDLIRMYLNQSSQKEILLSEEIDTLERYLELEKLRFEDKLVYDIEVKDEVNTNQITIPTMLIQPYIENALKHGLLHKKTTGHLIVKFSLNLDKSYLIVRVIDDGIGREKAAEIKFKQFRKHKSFATKANQDRLELLNFNKERMIRVETEDLNLDTKSGNLGTKVTIQIPVE